MVDQPILSRDPDELPGELPRGAEVPEDLDPLADGVLMLHQKEWLEDQSDLKLAEKGRRTGVTFAEALDATLIAAAKASAGGKNYFYIGDTKDKGREFIGYVAHFARIVAKDLGKIEEFLFEDQRPDGTTQAIAAFRIRFASGRRVEALSSRPENIRGLQGVVCIDEAAFHPKVRETLDAVNALLIWGGKIRVISTHNGVLSPFNELVREALAGRVPFKVHHIPFETAVANGLYKRVCLIQGLTWSPEAEEAWKAKIRATYGPRTAQMRQELDAEAMDSAGAALSRVQIEACMELGLPIVRWHMADDFKMAEQREREAITKAFCQDELLPVLNGFDAKLQYFLGEDFARSGDATAIKIFAIQQNLVRRTVLTVELRNIPFEQQRDVLFYVCDRLPRFVAGALDAAGNGAYLAEAAAQRYGSRISEVRATKEWYRTNSLAYVEAFGSRMVVLPSDDDILQDHQALQYMDGVIQVPANHRFKGKNGFNRHGDTAIAGILAWFASSQDPIEYGYRPATPPARRGLDGAASRGDFWRPDEDRDYRKMSSGRERFL